MSLSAAHQMTTLTSDRELRRLITEIKSIYCDYHGKKISLSKKIENYRKSYLLIQQAEHIIDELKQEMGKINTEHAKTDIKYVADLTALLEMPHLKFDEILYIVNQLRAMSNGLPIDASIVEHVETAVVEPTYRTIGTMGMMGTINTNENEVEGEMGEVEELDEEILHDFALAQDG